MTSWTRWGLIGTTFIAGATAILSAERSAQLSAESLIYQEDSHSLQLDHKVTITLDDVEVRADKLTIDTESNIASGTGNIIVRRGNDEFATDKISIDLGNEVAELSHITVTVQPSDMTLPVYLSAEKVVDRPQIKSGESATLTSCNLPDPHYFTWSQYFDYKPGHYILTFNTIVYMPILGVPFGFWTPFYYYEIGERQIIWNIPTVGKRETPGWGWFVQNTIDYDLVDDKSSSIFLDWYENKGIGWGGRHQFKWDASLSGAINYYRLDETNTGDKTEKKAIEATYTNGPFSISGMFDSMDGERINSLGRDAHDYQQFEVQYQDVGEVLNLKYSNRDDYVSETGAKSFAANYRYNGRSLFRFLQSENNFRSLKSSRALTNAGSTIDLPDRMIFNIDVGYDKDFQAETLDDQLALTTSLQKNFGPGFDATLSTSYKWDLDGETVTRDIASGRNNMLIALPKLTINYIDPSTFIIPVSQEFTIARFQEINYLVDQKALRIYPTTDQFTLEPNTILYKLDSSTSSTVPFFGEMATRFSYNQQLFKNPGRGWADSDAGYAIEFSESMANIHFGFLKTQATYTNRYVPNANNSPFITINLANSQQHDIAGSVRLFAVDEKLFYWHNESRFSWLSNRWDLYTTEIGVKPSPAFNGTVRFGKLLNPQSSEYASRFKPLEVNITSIPWKELELGYSFSMDLNNYIDNLQLNVLKSRITSKIILDTNPDYQWDLRTTLRYNTYNQQGVFDPSRYDIETINIAKQEHCRTFQFGYNKQSDEFTFQVTIVAFPGDTITIRKTRENWKLQGGALNESTQERL